MVMSKGPAVSAFWEKVGEIAVLLERRAIKLITEADIQREIRENSTVLYEAIIFVLELNTLLSVGTLVPALLKNCA